GRAQVALASEARRREESDARGGGRARDVAGHLPRTGERENPGGPEGDGGVPWDGTRGQARSGGDRQGLPGAATQDCEAPRNAVRGRDQESTRQGSPPGRGRGPDRDDRTVHGPVREGDARRGDSGPDPPRRA